MTSPRFTDALRLAATVHAHDTRKGTDIPYIAHLMSVASLVMVDGGSEDEAIAALLHDLLEDHPEALSADDLEERFGERVRQLVEACTDTPPGFSGGEKPAWRPRKEAYIAHVRAARPEDLRVSLADKVDNAQAMVNDYRELGELFWNRFSAGREEQFWYYGALVEAYREAGVTSRLLQRLESLVDDLWEEREDSVVLG